MSTQPKVSCICVTKNNTELLLRAIQCFNSQTYDNKELVIVYESDNNSIKRITQEYSLTDIKFFEVPIAPKKTLGELRNLAIGKSSGEYFCQWDDDDWYHNDRLKIQMEYLTTSHKDGCILIFWILYDVLDRQAYMSFPYPWEGSLLCKTKYIKSYKYPLLERGEDSHFVKELLDANVLFPVIMPTLYIYTYHRKNTWDYDHFKNLIRQSKKLNTKISLAVESVLNGTLNNEEASTLLSSSDILLELDYFGSIKNS